MENDQIGGGNLPLEDGMTGAAIGLDYPHSEIHAGNSYRKDVLDLTLDVDDEISISFKTSAAPGAQIHLVVLAQTTGGALLDLLSAPTVTVDSGTAEAAINKNQESSNTSAVSSIEAPPAVGEVTINGAITGDGTVIQAEAMGKGQTVSGTNRNLGEWILDYDTIYAARLTSKAANNVSQLTLIWYEHTPLP